MPLVIYPPEEFEALEDLSDGWKLRLEAGFSFRYACAVRFLPWVDDETGEEEWVGVYEALSLLQRYARNARIAPLSGPMDGFVVMDRCPFEGGAL